MPFKLTKNFLSFANTSIDVSDGLLADLEKLINKQNISYKLNLNSIPISINLNKLLLLKKMNKISFISRGDDYQVLFTANPRYRNFIKKISSLKKIKITLIGKILHSKHKSSIIDRNGHQIKIRSRGYIHRFD